MHGTDIGLINHIRHRNAIDKHVEIIDLLYRRLAIGLQEPKYIDEVSVIHQRSIEANSPSFYVTGRMKMTNKMRWLEDMNLIKEVFIEVKSLIAKFRAVAWHVSQPTKL